MAMHSTNLSTRSQEFDNAIWGKTNSTVSANATNAPDGTLTADLVVPSAFSGFHGIVRGIAGLGSDVPHTLSFYVKYSGYRWLWLDLVRPAVADYAAYFDIQNGVLGSKHPSVTSTIEALANGWYRCSVSVAGAVGWTSANIQPFIGTADAGGGNPPASFSGDGVSGMYFWGAQIEDASSSSSYIVTTSSTVTRPTDIVTFNDLTWFDGSSDSIYANWTAKNVNNSTVWAFDATNDKLLIETTGMSPNISGATTSNTVAAGANVKIGARMALDNFAISMNGGTVATDVSETAPGALTASRIGLDLVGANSLNGYIKRVAAFKGLSISNPDLQTLST